MSAVRRLVGPDRVDDRPFATGFSGVGHTGAVAAVPPAPVAFDVPGEVVPWSRPRFNRRTKAVFNDARIRGYEALVYMLAKRAMAGRPPLAGAVEVAITVVLAVPASWPKRRRDAALIGDVAPTGKPDWDNAAKGLLDAICGVVIRDDTQVVDARVTKVYGEAPKAAVVVKPWGPPRW